MLLAFFSWWYGEGWRRQANRSLSRLARQMDTFSIELLLRTFFSPFRQISAGRVQGPLGMQLRIILDKIISRCIGAMIRSVMLVIGSAVVVCGAVIGVVQVAMWPFVPLLPLVGIYLALTGWVPWR